VLDGDDWLIEKTERKRAQQEIESVEEMDAAAGERWELRRA